MAMTNHFGRRREHGIHSEPKNLSHALLNTINTFLTNYVLLNVIHAFLTNYVVITRQWCLCLYKAEAGTWKLSKDFTVNQIQSKHLSALLLTDDT